MTQVTLIQEVSDPHCSYPVSFLLREQGFDVPCRWYYDTEYHERTWHVEYEPLRNSEIRGGYGKLRYEMLSAPSHSVATEWIRINFGINLIPIEQYTWQVQHRWKYQIINTRAADKHYGNKEFIVESELEYADPVQAIDAGLLYILENLIA